MRKHRTRNPRIPRCAMAHLRSGGTAPSRNDGVWIASSASLLARMRRVLDSPLFQLTTGRTDDFLKFNLVGKADRVLTLMLSACCGVRMETLALDFATSSAV